MAHCTYDQIKDLEGIFAQIRRWPGIREPKPGIFYLKGMPFLHFHTKDGHRWADARCGADWGSRIPIHPNAGSTERKSFASSGNLGGNAVRAW